MTGRATRPSARRVAWRARARAGVRAATACLLSLGLGALLAGPAWAGETRPAEIDLQVSANNSCSADPEALNFDLGVAEEAGQDISQVKVLHIDCALSSTWLTLQASLQAEEVQAGGEVPTLEASYKSSSGPFYDLHRGIRFDASTYWIRVTYHTPVGVGQDTFTGQLNLSWP